MRNELTARLAADLGVDYEEILRLRMLRLMSSDQVAEVARAGIDIQLHTHRHRTPCDEALFRREIAANRNWIEARTGKRPTHFCYPSGVHFEELLPWLRAEKVVSAVTHGQRPGKSGRPAVAPASAERQRTLDRGWISGLAGRTARPVSCSPALMRRAPRPRATAGARSLLMTYRNEAVTSGITSLSD